MRKSKYPSLLLLLVLGACSHAPKTNLTPTSSPKHGPITDLKPTVILVSIDGFRPKYLSPENTPALLAIAAHGVRATSMIPVFPSKTFPNHYSIITGLYPEKHGIVANSFKDPRYPENFVITKKEIVNDSKWWGGEPLWVTAEKQGQISASMFWVGSSAEIQGVRPHYWKNYDRKFTRESRVQQILDWIDLPADQRPTFLTLYFDEVDSVGHEKGPDSPEVLVAAQQVDQSMGVLSQGLRERGILEQINLIVVSDHGMATVEPDHYIHLRDYIDLADVELIDGGPTMAITPKAGKEGEIYRKLKHAHPKMKVYWKREIPSRYHYRKNDRIPPILALADTGWMIAGAPVEAKEKPRGMHGYDNLEPTMGALFLAQGPAFKSGVTIKPFLNLAVYPLVTQLLGLKPAPHDGNLKEIASALKSKPRK